MNEIREWQSDVNVLAFQFWLTRSSRRTVRRLVNFKGSWSHRGGGKSLWGCWACVSRAIEPYFMGPFWFAPVPNVRSCPLLHSCRVQIQLRRTLLTPPWAAFSIVYMVWASATCLEYAWNIFNRNIFTYTSGIYAQLN